MPNRNALKRALPSLLLLTGLLAALIMPPIPYVRSSPGGTFNALGQANGQTLVSVQRTKAYPTYRTSGDLRILTVSELGGPIGPLPLGDGIRSVWDRSIVLQPSGFVYPDSVTNQQVSDEGAYQFHSATSDAIAAALNELGIPLVTELSIMEVNPNSPADGKLQVGDLVQSLGGAATADLDALQAALARHSAGERVAIRVKRGAKQLTVRVTLGKSAAGKPLIGVLLLQTYAGPMNIKFELDHVGGPSAGLAFSLAIYDKLTPGKLLAGRTVAVTGTIAPDGAVGAIGGLHQKLTSAARAGARLMLIPADNCRDLAGDIPNGLQVTPVRSLAAAISALQAANPAKLPVCPAQS